MHPCLSVPEILHLVCKDVHRSSKPEVHDKKSLLAVALSCKDFKSPALNIMWDEQESLFPLLRCLPLDSRKVKVSRSPMGKITSLSITRELVQEDWDRPRFYAAFIKRITIQGSSTYISGQGIYSNSWSLLMRAAKSLNVILFPHLHSIDFSPNGDAGLVLRFLEPLISSKLSSLRASPGTLDEIRSIRTIASRSTHLLSFRFRLRLPVSEYKQIKQFVQTVSDAIRSCHCLVTADVNIHDIDQHAFQYLFRLKDLQNLYLHDSPSYGQKILQPVSQSCGGFQEFRHLEVNFKRLQFAVEILEKMRSALLRSVDLSTMHDEEASAYNSLFTLLTKSGSARSLIHLSVLQYRRFSGNRSLSQHGGTVAISHGRTYDGFCLVSVNNDLFLHLGDLFSQ